MEWMHSTIAYHPLAVALAKVMLSEIKVNEKALWQLKEATNVKTDKD